MQRKKPNSLIAKWKGAFPHGKDKAVEVEKLPDQDGQQSDGPTLVLIRKQPVTFQLSRSENPKDFELMCFVARVCLKTADRPYRTVIHVEQTRSGSRLVATDGLRLHVAEISKKIKSGDYKPHVAKDTISLGEAVEGIDFPTWTKVVPDKAKALKRGVINLEKSGFGRNRKKTENLSIAMHSFVKQTGEAVNVRFLEDLTKREWMVYSQNEKRKAVVLRQKPTGVGESEDKGPMAVIMPIAVAA